MNVFGVIISSFNVGGTTGFMVGVSAEGPEGLSRFGGWLVWGTLRGILVS